MTENKDNMLIPDEIIMKQIYYIRGHKEFILKRCTLHNQIARIGLM